MGRQFAIQTLCVLPPQHTAQHIRKIELFGDIREARAAVKMRRKPFRDILGEPRVREIREARVDAAQ